MKQFQYTKPSGLVNGPFAQDEARDYMIAYRLPAWVTTAAVGDTCEDSDGDVWQRLPDLAQPDYEPIISDEPKRDERLERIATAVLAGLASVPNNSLNLTPDDVRRLDVESSVKYAKALIAELDKQA